MKLYLVQHGEAEPRESSDERQLTERGEEDVLNVAEFLKNADVTVDRIIHSGKLRAQQTAAILSNALAEGAVLEITSMIGPNDPVEPFAQEIRELTSDTMVVGHMPFMARLVSYFTTGNSAQIFTEYQPGSVVCLERGDGGQWKIQWMLRPELF